MAGIGSVPIVRDSLNFPDEIGSVVVYLDNESRLARLPTNRRSERKQAAIDRYFEFTGQHPL